MKYFLMKYFLRNIAQNSPLRTGILLVLGGLMWVPSILCSEAVGVVWVTLGLTLINSLLWTRYFYKGGLTNLPSHFVLSTSWFILSAMPMLHSAWQAQVVVLGVLSALLVLQKKTFQQEATEEAFLATLICCILAPLQSVMITGVIMIWGYLLMKGYMSWRVWIASLMAIAVRVILMLVLHYLGWMEWIWLENIPHLTWQIWVGYGGLFVATMAALLLPLQKPSVASGAIYMILIIGLAIFGMLWNGHVLQSYYLEKLI